MSKISFEEKDDDFDNDSKFSQKYITPNQKLNFAYFNIVLFSMFLFIACLGFYLKNDQSGRMIFDKAVIIIPPILTSILTNYFKKN